MNTARQIISGIKAAIAGSDPGAHMDVSRAAFAPSFVGLAAAGFLIIASARLLSGAQGLPLPITIITAGLWLLTAPVMMYLISHLLSRPEVFRPWVIVRNWILLPLALAAFAIVALGAAGILPAGVTATLAMAIYVSTLIVDIRLAQTMATPAWTPAIFIACAISIAGMLVILAVFSSAAGY